MKTILVADDEPSIRRLIQVNLERAGYHVVAVENGKLAWERLLQGGIDLLVTDLMMPELDGLALIEMLKRDSALASLPILVLGARPNTLPMPANEGSVVVGEIPYLLKPLGHPCVLLSLIARLLLQPASVTDEFRGYRYG